MVKKTEEEEVTEEEDYEDEEEEIEEEDGSIQFIEGVVFGTRWEQIRVRSPTRLQEPY